MARLKDLDEQTVALVSQYIANEIRAELVCCDVYDHLHPILAAMPAEEMADVTDENTRGHAICYWGEAAARIAEGAEEE